MKTLRLFALAVCWPVACLAGYVYDFPSLLNPYTASQWTANGTISASNNLVTSSSAGSLIFNPTVPGASNAYEVRTTIAISQTSSAHFDTYLRATSNALNSGTSWTGSAYNVSIVGPTVSGSSCTATLRIGEFIANGSDHTLSALSVPCHSGMVVRSVITQSNYILVYIDNVLYATVYDTQIVSGQPGIKVSKAPSSDGITAVDIGHLDTVAPSAVPTPTVSFGPGQVGLQWQAVTDDPNGTGLYAYRILRNGALLTETTSTSFTDTTIISGTDYNYSINPVDYHFNQASTPYPITPPFGGVAAAGEVGVRPAGSYWGAGGEQIDMRSGNLNYTMPLLKPLGRGGWGVGFSLNYNSQTWRQDSAGTWQLGADLGYGYGWRLQAGSLTPIYSTNWTLDHYLFVDSSGAEYRLNVNNSGVWSSQEGIYVFYDSNANTLHFRDGSFWVMGCTSYGLEPDTGTMYPTLMEDTNGNQIVITYLAGFGSSQTNTSSRINTIEDVRGKGSSDYTFNYTVLNTGDPFPHLTHITNHIQSGEDVTLTYTSTAQALVSPFDGVTTYPAVYWLLTAKRPSLNPTSFTYDSSGSGELDEMATPYGGHLRWSYTSYTLSGVTQREVQNRYVSLSSGATETAIQLIRANDSSYQVHSSATLDDLPANAEKYWTFQTDVNQFNAGLQLSYEERQLPSHTALSHRDFTWAQTATTLNPYIGTTLTTLDPGQSYQAQKQTTQTLDQYGNLTQAKVYDFGNLSTPARTYTNTYLTGSQYSSRYILNRLTSSSVSDGTNSATLVSNGYDGNTLTNVTGMYEHDTNYGTSFLYRGDVTSSSSPTTSTSMWYDIGGNVTKTTNNGVTTTATTSSLTNFAAPDQMTTNSLNSSMTWSTFLGPSTATGPNGDQGSLSYDTNARPSTTTSPYGAVTTYTYADTASPPYKSASTNTHTVTNFLDGFGHTFQTNTAGGSALSVVQTVYGPCGCSPLGKVIQQSEPWTTGGTVYWTTYAYDASGRTLSVTLPDGSATTYVYQGNTVTVTDPAGKWKTFTMDAMGNLTTVVEPDPALGNVTTTYTYDVLNHLAGVSVPRGAYTQTRTFNYTSSHTVGAFLLSATNPENGTVTYTYNGNHTLASKTDAKGQQLTYQYDSYNRLTSVTWANAPGGAQVLRTFIYDTNTIDSSYSGYTAGRLVAVQYPGIAPTYPNGAYGTINLVDEFAYTQSGLASGKRMKVTEANVRYQIHGQNFYTNLSLNLDSAYTYNNEGKLTAMTYPTTTNNSFYNGNPSGIGTYPGASYNYSYDAMNRLSGMTDANNNNAAVVNNVTYNPANQLLTLTVPGTYSETRTYNTLGQLTGLNNGAENLAYNYSTGTNNGKIASKYNAVSGETVTYQYDSLNRLASASAGSTWGEAYTYDGFGNLTAKTVTAGSGPTLSVAPNPNTNHLGGEDANGNEPGYTYDVENRIIQVGNSNGIQYAYDAQNKRNWSWPGTLDPLNNRNAYTVYYFTPGGQKLGAYQINVVQTSTPTIYVTLMTSDRYFGGKRLAPQDRLGSAGDFYPWGEAKGSNNPQDTWSYATYWRDSASGLDYANNRYYSNQYGRFMTPDPAGLQAARPDNPTSWNRYAYTAGDPANRLDPTGLDDFGFVDIGEYDGGWYCDPICQDQETFAEIGTYAGPTAQDMVCQALIMSFAQDGGAWNSNCGPVPTIPVATTSGGPCPQTVSNAANLDYSQLLHKGNTQSTEDHIIENHMHGTTPGKSQYSASYFWQVVGTNFLTFLFGAEVYDPGTNTVDFFFTGTAPNWFVGWDASGNETATNLLVLQPDCKTVVTSYPVPSTD
ncbi:MAG TPA: RHS repeat-associated core domain-containing protein [Bryobacteraceae bacterium]|nr:RHS repeat-associated core domain-containing protein [Bryobacteraceae bacterium]